MYEIINDMTRSEEISLSFVRDNGLALIYVNKMDIHYKLYMDNITFII